MHGSFDPHPPRGLKPQVENTALDVLVTSLLGAHWKGQDNMKKDLNSMLITVLFTKAKTGTKTKVLFTNGQRKHGISIKRNIIHL